jgi:hypothetical protein
MSLDLVRLRRDVQLTSRAYTDSSPRCPGMSQIGKKNSKEPLPSAHECQHKECRSHGLIILGAGLCRVPLRRAKYLHEHDGKEQKEDEPETKQTHDHRKTSTVNTRVNQRLQQSAMERNIRHGLEELIQRICSLNEFEGDAD